MLINMPQIKPESSFWDSSKCISTEYLQNTQILVISKTLTLPKKKKNNQNCEICILALIFLTPRAATEINLFKDTDK